MAVLAVVAAMPACNRDKRDAVRQSRQEQAADQSSANTSETPYAAAPSAEQPSAGKSSSEQPKTVPADKLRFEKIEGFLRTGLLSGELTVRVSNDTRYTITVEDAVATLRYAGSRVGALVLLEAVAIPKRATSSLTVPIEAEIGNPLAIYGVWNKVLRGELSEITVSVEATLAAGIVRRRIVKNDIPLGALLDAAGITADDIRNMVK